MLILLFSPWYWYSLVIQTVLKVETLVAQPNAPSDIMTGLRL